MIRFGLLRAWHAATPFLLGCHLRACPLRLRDAQRGVVRARVDLRAVVVDRRFLSLARPQERKAADDGRDDGEDREHSAAQHGSHPNPLAEGPRSHAGAGAAGTEACSTRSPNDVGRGAISGGDGGAGGAGGVDGRAGARRSRLGERAPLPLEERCELLRRFPDRILFVALYPFPALFMSLPPCLRPPLLRPCFLFSEVDPDFRTRG